MENKRTPDIRFAGFTGDWEEHRLEEVAEFNPKSKLPEQFEYVDLESVLGTNLISHRTEQKETAPSRAQRLAKRGDVFYQTVRPYQKNNYLFDLPYDNYVFSTGYAQMRPYVDSYFLLNRLQDERFVSTVLDRCTGTSYPAINSNDLAQIETSVPVSKEEQAQIGNFFKQLDDTIALHQQELTILKQTKQGFLQKMFPKEGESVPEVRFPGFTGEWEQRKLGDLSEIRRGASPRPIEDPKWFDDESDVGWLRISDVTEQNGLIHHVKQHISEEGQKKTLVLNEPHLILSIAATVGKPVINYIKTGVHDGFIVFINPKFNIDFIFQWLEMFRPKWQKYGQPGSQVNINSELVREQNVFLPSLEEQEKISKFFKRFDETIALHQRELDALKETKKAFLQKMFV
ncbi:MAG: restriction endonuclease subunit S [Paenibacillus dendritiformis]|uniref:restriction endonuclease subunit S n=1 Tax=Paenibacillus dendritiformis TaxID=130049 RepID=UPI001B1FE0E9|nr:restriction endonuclease subunit S [Paenibacillus dendritiformis]MDU5143573.1 restriction endonuclease subunit S [Paenibacillus dendritiformis]GIO73308.1 restriction endonuclease subunit S [Paenibacillus dendritiformis]